MFIGHLPSGYLLTRSLGRALRVSGWMWLGLLASVFPDIDLAWFYLVDHRRAMHHHYWIHRPFDWLLIGAAWIGLGAALRLPRLRTAAYIVLPNIFLHLLLDSIVGKIDWLYPWRGRGYSLFEVKPAHHEWYVANYLFHWTFCFEIFVLVWAGAALWRDWMISKRAATQRRSAPASSS